MNTEDEINVAAPGFIDLQVYEEEGNITYKHNTDLSTYTQLQKDEYEIGQIYAAAVKSEMEKSENEIFERFLKSELPGKAQVNVSRFWLH